MTLNRIRAEGFWIIGCTHAVSEFIAKCVKCRKYRRPTETHKMSDLPEERLKIAPPFTYCGVDLFGPWLIKEGRKELKRYGVLFTCMSCRAVHLETANSLTTDSFINALRRFLAIRGPIRQLRSDRGTNIIGAKNELKANMPNLNQEQITEFLRKEGCDWFEFKFNVPSSSHMGGAWERQIRTIRSVLTSILDNAGGQLDDESLRTFMMEAAAIVNSRPLTVENLNDPKSSAPITPNQLLTMKTKVLLPPVGSFQDADIYSRKYWRRVQHLANVFWSRWVKEFLPTLQVRQKWTKEETEIQIGDVVLVKDENLARNSWPLARVVEVFPSQDQRVRKVKLAMGDAALDARGRRKRDVTYLERPIHKLVVLVRYSSE